MNISLSEDDTLVIIETDDGHISRFPIISWPEVRSAVDNIYNGHYGKWIDDVAEAWTLN